MLKNIDFLFLTKKKNTYLHFHQKKQQHQNQEVLRATQILESTVEQQSEYTTINFTKY